MGNRMNVMIGRSEVGTSRRQRRGEAAVKEGTKRARSKQAVGVNELSWRQYEERLQVCRVWSKDTVDVTISSTANAHSAE
jgi:hypothetical protein